MSFLRNYGNDGRNERKRGISESRTLLSAGINFAARIKIGGRLIAKS